MKSLTAACTIGVRLLSSREHSRFELINKLTRRGINRDTANKAVDKLTEEGFASDSRYTESCIRKQIERGQGPLKIRAYLQEHGIDSSLIANHLPSEDDFWLKRAALADKKCRDRHNFSNEEALSHTSRAVRGRHLHNRGYPAGVIFKVLGSRD